MRSRVCLVVLCGSLSVGCGDDGTTDMDPGDMTGDVDPANEGFRKPNVPLTAYLKQDDQWVAQGPADFGCLNSPGNDPATTVDVRLTGAVLDFQRSTPVPGAEVSVFHDADLDNFVDTTVADEDGGYQLSVPAGAKRLGFKITAPQTMETYQLNYLFEPDTGEQPHNVNSVSELTANALSAFVGVTRTPGLGVLAGSVRDCQGREVGGAIATVSGLARSPEHLNGAQTYYFSAGGTSLPVRHSAQSFTNTDSLFVVIELPPGQGFLQTWGYLSQQDVDDDTLTLLAELPMPIRGDSVITAAMEPLRE